MNEQKKDHSTEVSRRAALASGTLLASSMSASVAFSEDDVKRESVPDKTAFDKVKGLMDFIHERIGDAKDAKKKEKGVVRYSDLKVTFVADDLIKRMPTRDELAKIFLASDDYDFRRYDNDNTTNQDGPHKPDS